MLNQSIFKSYDVRGIYPSELNEQAAFAVGKAFIKHTNAKNVVVGYDARLSSPALFKALTAGLLAAGAKVTTIGQTPTEGLYFAVGSYAFDSGIMITASHNPKDYNGLKMMVRKGTDIEWIRGKDLLAIVEESPLVENTTAPDELNIWPDYVKHMLQFSGQVKPFKIVVDASNGVMGSVMDMVASHLPCQIIPLNYQPDGNFPNHSPNPLEPGASDQIAQEIKAQKADFGFMFDADADRIFLVDENGQLIPADTVLLLLAKHLLQKSPGAAIAYNVVCSKSVPEFIEKWGGKAIRTKVGFVNVREGVINNNGVMGGEISAHYCFRDYFYCDSGMIAFLTLLQIISQENKPVSQLVAEFMIYHKAAELNFKIEDREAVVQKVKEKYADAKQDYLDGVTVTYPDWWFNARPSNTEPLLKISLLEATSQELLEEKKKELVELIEK